MNFTKAKKPDGLPKKASKQAQEHFNFPFCEVANSEHNASNCLETTTARRAAQTLIPIMLETNKKLQFQGEKWKGNCYPFTFVRQCLQLRSQ